MPTSIGPAEDLLSASTVLWHKVFDYVSRQSKILIAPSTSFNFADIMKRRFLIAAAITLAFLAILYAGDYGMVRYKIPRRRSPFGQVVVQPFYVIHQKNGKIDYEMGDPETDVCVRSLFPHMGYSPCWYLGRHTQKQIDI